MDQIIKYPRTQHIFGSRLQDGDEDLEAVPFEALLGQYLVVEEKLDGANSGISFDNDGNLMLQSRGHYLDLSNICRRERHFNLLKTWANRHLDQLFDILENRYIMYGEWMYCKHTVFYDQLSHYFHEFDIYDKQTKIFLSTEERRKKIGKAPIISVPVIWEGEAKSLKHLKNLIGVSLYKSVNWKNKLIEVAEMRNIDSDLVVSQTSTSDLAEGIYIKSETKEKTIGRYKYVRPDFLQSIQESETHWIDRPIVPNQLSESSDIFADDLHC